MRCATLLATLLSSLLLLLSLSPSPCSGQAYVPNVPPFTPSNCPPGQSFVQVGRLDASNATAFPNNQQGAQLGTYWSPFYQYVYTTPFTNRHFGAVLSQVAVAVLDNSGLPGPVYFRVAIYLFQEAQRNIMNFNQASLLSQTDEVTLYPSKDQVIYVNLLQNVTLESEGDYGIGIYASDQFYIAGGPRASGFSAEGQFLFQTEYYNDYSAPQAVFLYPGDRSHPVAAFGCLDVNAFDRPGLTYYAFCALVEEYRRQPANNTNVRVTSMTNVTRFSGVIAVNSSVWKNDSKLGAGQPIVYMEGDVQRSSNIGALSYPPAGYGAVPFTYRLQHPDFPQATDLLYPYADIPIDENGIVITTSRNRTRLFRTNRSIDSTISAQGQTGALTNTYFSSFKIFPKEQLDTVITNCNVPSGYAYFPDQFSCPAGSAWVQFGDVNTLDLDPLEESEIYDYFPPNFIAFRYFTVYTPSTRAYQLSYFTYSNENAVVHMRMAIFRTNTTYVNSFSALPEYELLAMTREIELVNVGNTLVVSNLITPVDLKQGGTYAIGVWADTMLYGPQAHWGVDAAGLTLPYVTVDQDGSFPGTIYALGGQTGVQPMGVNACAAAQSLLTFQWCATFADYVFIIGLGWFLETRYYTGTLTTLSTSYSNDWGTYYIMTSGNGTFIETFVPVAGPPAPPFDSAYKLGQQRKPSYINGTWNLNNFQVQSPDYLYVTSAANGLMLDQDGMQVIVNIATASDNVVYATIIQAVRPRGSPTWYYQESVELDYHDDYEPEPNSAAQMSMSRGSDAAPSCPDFAYVPWDLTWPGNEPMDVDCVGLGNIQATYGDNRVLDYSYNQEGHVIPANTVYTVSVRIPAGTLLTQVSIDVLNNTGVSVGAWVSCWIGIYSPNMTLISQTQIAMLEVLDQMIVADLYPNVNLTTSGQYLIAMLLDTDFAVATTQQTGATMNYSAGGLPTTFTPTGTAQVPPIVVYGCVQASHYFCASFQYYQGDNYAPITYDFLYQGLLLADTANTQTNDYGTWAPLIFGVGHLSVFARIANYPINWRVGFTDMILSRPGNASMNHVYVQSNNGQPLDTTGLNFITADDFGYGFDLFYDLPNRRYNDSTNAQLGSELQWLFQLQPIDFSMGVPQCSFLDLPQLVTPQGTLINKTQCDANANSHAVIWGDDVSGDYFYNNEGLNHLDFYIITLTPFNTGGDYSLITELAISITQNANVFQHCRMALYDMNNTIMSDSNEVQVVNSQDNTLYFTLHTPVLLQPASQYQIAYWTDIDSYTAAGSAYTAHCYYGLQYGYDLGPWPVTVGSVEAEYYDCNPLPVAALGCTTTGSPPYIPPTCPEVKEEGGTSTAGVAAAVLVTAIISVLATLLIQRMVTTGRCKREGWGAGGVDDDSHSATLRGSSDSGASNGGKYAAMSD